MKETAWLAEGMDLKSRVKAAKRYVVAAMRAVDEVSVNVVGSLMTLCRAPLGSYKCSTSSLATLKGVSEISEMGAYLVFP